MSRLPKTFHFSRLYHGDQPDKALARHQHYLFSRLRLKPGMRVLDIGCGTGQVALELANFYNVQVVGIDKSSKKIQEASRLAQNMSMSNQVTFMHTPCISKINNYPELGTFDAIYAIESLAVRPDLQGSILMLFTPPETESSFEDVYHQCYILLKPSGYLGVYEWCWTSEFDPTDVDHCRLASMLEESTGIGHREPTERLISTALKALERSHFQVIEWEDLAKSDGKTSRVPWYKPLEHAIQSPELEWPLSFGEFPRDSATILLHAGIYNVFTPMAMIISRCVDLELCLN